MCQVTYTIEVVVVFLLGDSQASEFYVLMIWNIKFIAYIFIKTLVNITQSYQINCE